MSDVVYIPCRLIFHPMAEAIDYRVLGAISHLSPNIAQPHCEATIEDLAAEIDESKWTVAPSLKRLVDMGLLERKEVGEGRLDLRVIP